MKENTGAVHVQLPVDVATFLLNEKRVDIHTIESRLKVNVVLIPNIHMETPHYTMTRLRHDELNQRDAAEPSYKMATLPEAESGYQAEQAPPPVRQEAAVKSIAPPKPMPGCTPRRGSRAAGSGRPARPHRRLVQEAGRRDARPPNIAPAQPVAAITRSERPSERRERSNERKPGQRRGRGEGRNGEARNGDARQSEPRQSAPRQNEARGSEHGQACASAAPAEAASRSRSRTARS